LISRWYCKPPCGNVAAPVAKNKVISPVPLLLRQVLDHLQRML